MILTTLMMAAPIALAIHSWRHGLRQLPRAWGALRWWERCLLVACFAPIPGPLDEIAMAVLISRGLKRLEER